MFRTIVISLLAITISGCAALNLKRPVAEEDIGKTKRIGVVSILGETFYGVSIGMTVFNNTYFSASVPEWHLDAFAASAATDLLRSNTRFESREMDRTGLSIDQVRPNDSKPMWEAAEKQGFDTLVILRPGVSDNHTFFKPGFGLFERSMFGSAKRCVYAAYIVDIYDVSKRKPIAWEWGGGMPCQLGSDNQFTFKGSFNDYSSEEKQAMRRRLEARMSESLRYSLEKLLLVPRATK